VSVFSKRIFVWSGVSWLNKVSGDGDSGFLWVHPITLTSIIAVSRDKMYLEKIFIKQEIGLLVIAYYYPQLSN
jgi:hypothetical protein